VPSIFGSKLLSQTVIECHGNCQISKMLVMRGVLTRMASWIWGHLGSLKPNGQGTKGGWPCYTIQGSTSQAPWILLLHHPCLMQCCHMTPFHTNWIWLEKCNPTMYSHCTLEHNLHSTPPPHIPSSPHLQCLSSGKFMSRMKNVEWWSRSRKEKHWHFNRFVCIVCQCLEMPTFASAAVEDANWCKVATILEFPLKKIQTWQKICKSKQDRK
jgi:hypothetical protein